MASELSFFILSIFVIISNLCIFLGSDNRTTKIVSLTALSIGTILFISTIIVNSADHVQSFICG